MKKNIIFFDGVCNLCNKAVDFFIKRDIGGYIHYAPLQGTTAKEVLDSKVTDDLNTVVFYQEGKVYYKSEAILRALVLLGPKYALTSLFLIVPEFIRDFFYDLIAKNRYKIFGKKETCRLPLPHEKKLFLD
jgi:predicted DCC family thiol-disulfide oxidoreductase YuxK